MGYEGAVDMGGEVFDEGEYNEGEYGDEEGEEEGSS
jgi:hypothetical protein